jgi:hypothetical protein
VARCAPGPERMVFQRRTPAVRRNVVNV